MEHKFNREQNQLHQQKVLRANRSLDATKEFVKDGIYRQRFHLMPEAYWLSDPNGFVYYKGRYHLFYQCNPYSTVWANMHWGHAVSDDLINWEHHGVALAPSEPYDDNLKGGVWSGTSVVHQERLYVLYTSCIINGDQVTQSQSLAMSEDGENFYKYADNPVLKAPPELDAANFRDPKIWYHNEFFYCLVSSQIQGDGCLGIFKSKNLINWDYQGIFYQSNGMYGSMWECPDFFYLDGQYVLQFCPMNMKEIKSVCLVGDFDYDTLQFRPRDMYESDAGFDFYGAQTVETTDGRRVMVGYQNGWPWMPWFRDFGLGQLENWCGCVSLPREHHLRMP
ncbi:sucrose-6-phosphate hydrolase SacC (GH32 family) [Lachnospiraceae bacterium PF1-22]|uniref:glycoside hydrolase family 32 protein n=1 Tax=Ohessyouella blattaphilus TaxID=2949333 RepID=UPI003E3296E6